MAPKEEVNYGSEDYIDNKDQREYNVTGSLKIEENSSDCIDGSPLATGEHKMRLHKSINVQIDSLVLELIANYSGYKRHSNSKYSRRKMGIGMVR